VTTSTIVVLSSKESMVLFSNNVTLRKSNPLKVIIHYDRGFKCLQRQRNGDIIEHTTSSVVSRTKKEEIIE